MHFEDVTKKFGNEALRKRLNAHLLQDFSKADKGILRALQQKDNMHHAVSCAKKLEKYYDTHALELRYNIAEMNPYTTVHSLVALLLEAL